MTTAASSIPQPTLPAELSWLGRCVVHVERALARPPGPTVLLAATCAASSSAAPTGFTGGNRRLIPLPKYGPTTAHARTLL